MISANRHLPRLWLAIASLLLAQPLAAAPFFHVGDGNESHEEAVSPLFYEDKERGWFWYEPEPVAEPEPEPEPNPMPTPEPLKKPVATVQARPQPDQPLSSAWFRANLTKYRDTAIDDPTPDNVSRYLYLQRVMLDKAERFTEVSQRVVMADPLLDENSRRPIATFGANAMDEQAEQGVNKAIKHIARQAGLWFFYSSTCSYCIKEAGVLNGLSHAHGFKVLPIALDGLPLPGNDFPHFTVDQGQARRLGVDTTPALFLVKPGADGDVIQLGQGLLAGEDIIKRALVLGYQRGWLDKDGFDETRKAKPLTLDPATVQSLTDADISDPALLADKIKTALRGQLPGGGQ